MKLDTQPAILRRTEWIIVLSSTGSFLVITHPVKLNNFRFLIKQTPATNLPWGPRHAVDPPAVHLLAAGLMEGLGEVEGHRYLPQLAGATGHTGSPSLKIVIACPAEALQIGCRHGRHIEL
jgi:hypothetical protein